MHLYLNCSEPRVPAPFHVSLWLPPHRFMLSRLICRLVITLTLSLRWRFMTFESSLLLFLLCTLWTCRTCWMQYVKLLWPSLEIVILIYCYIVDRGPLMLLTPRSACPSPLAFYWETSVFYPLPFGWGCSQPCWWWTNILTLQFGLRLVHLLTYICVSALGIANYITASPLLLQWYLCYCYITVTASVFIAWFPLAALP